MYEYILCTTASSIGVIARALVTQPYRSTGHTSWPGQDPPASPETRRDRWASAKAAASTSVGRQGSLEVAVKMAGHGVGHRVSCEKCGKYEGMPINANAASNVMSRT